jgi:ADP-heptose:LPS heptosyltransferase
MSAHNRIQKTLIGASSHLTRRHSRTGARFLDFVIPPLFGNSLLSDTAAARNRKIVRRIRSFRRILVLPDIHIGDAVMTQSTISALRDLFPGAEVDYVINQTAFPLIEGNSEATRVLPLFRGGAFPSAALLEQLRELVNKGGYDLCLNHSPFIKDKDIAFPGMRILNFMTRAPVIILQERFPGSVNHFIYHMYNFAYDLLASMAPQARAKNFRKVRLSLSDSAVERARRFATQAGLSPARPGIMINPDAASPYSRMPFQQLVDLVGLLARLEVTLLLGAGHTELRIGERIKAALPSGFQEKIKIIPADFPLEAYAALIDCCDVFISGDTGPLHIAAARKISRTGRYPLRNRTAVLSFFGATPARLSGYDSGQPGFLAANQDAPSWTFVSRSPCRNITCLDKLYKTCAVVRCFEGLDLEGMVERAGSYVQAGARRPAPASGREAR